MTAADWPVSTDPLALVRHLRGKPLLSPSRWFRWAVTAPPPLPERKLAQLLDAVLRHAHPDNPVRAAAAGFHDQGAAVTVASLAALVRTFTGSAAATVEAEVYLQAIGFALAADRDNPPLAAAVRCLFGDPFRPVTDPAGWRTATVCHLARGIEADAAFDRLPVLADALEDAGCDHPQLLAHLRGGGSHQPGCHALDVVLGR